MLTVEPVPDVCPCCKSPRKKIPLDEEFQDIKEFGSVDHHFEFECGASTSRYESYNVPTYADVRKAIESGAKPTDAFPSAIAELEWAQCPKAMSRVAELEAALRTIFEMPKGEQHAQIDRRAMVQIAGAALGVIKPNSTV